MTIFFFALDKSTLLLYAVRMVPVALSYSKARQNLASAIKTCVDDSTPVIISSRQRKVVMMALDEWEAWQETMLQLSSPANVRHLNESLEQKQRGETVVMTPGELVAFMQDDEA